MAKPHAKSGQVIDLRPLGAGLKIEKTTALVKSESFEAIRLIIRAGVEIPPHQVTGNITLHCLESCVLLGLTESLLELSAGEWVYLTGNTRHFVKGIEDSSLLLTIMFDR